MGGSVINNQLAPTKLPPTKSLGLRTNGQLPLHSKSNYSDLPSALPRTNTFTGKFTLRKKLYIYCIIIPNLNYWRHKYSWLPLKTVIFEITKFFLVLSCFFTIIVICSKAKIYCKGSAINCGQCFLCHELIIIMVVVLSGPLW